MDSQIARTSGLLQRGGVIPAHPLALDAEGRLDTPGQRALTRYYLDSGAAGIAVGVHTTQFAIRAHGLYEEVLRIASETVEAERARGSTILIAGLYGNAEQLVAEAEVAASNGYDAALVALAALKDRTEAEVLSAVRHVGDYLPVVGFAMQEAIGGRRYPAEFWRAFANIESVHAVKVALFDRYATLELLEGVATSDRADRITIYTGNDDHIVGDLTEAHSFPNGVSIKMAGGLLGHWAVWTRAAVRVFDAASRGAVDGLSLTLASDVTQCNAAIFDAANHFHGCIAGINYVLWTQGLLRSPRCLEPIDILSPGQRERIELVRRQFAYLTDDDWVAANVQRWRA